MRYPLLAQGRTSVLIHKDIYQRRSKGYLVNRLFIDLLNSFVEIGMSVGPADWRHKTGQADQLIDLVGGTCGCSCG